LLDSTLAGKLTAMARFRNLFVHRYWQVDNEGVLKCARQDVDDLETYLGAIRRTLMWCYELAEGHLSGLLGG